MCECLFVVCRSDKGCRVMMMGSCVSYSSVMNTYGTAHAADLQHWQYHYFSLVVWQAVKQCFMVVFALNHSNSTSLISWWLYDVQPEPTTLLTQATFKLPYNIGMA